MSERSKTWVLIQQVLFSTQDSRGCDVVGTEARATQITRTLKEHRLLTEEATEIDLMTVWLKMRRDRGDKLLTRSAEAETRHVCLYAKQQLERLRTEVTRPDIMPGHVIIEIKDVIADLESLAAYLESGKGGGFSALKEK